MSFDAITFESWSMPMGDENNRSSENYDFSVLSGTARVRIIAPKNIMFDLFYDVSWGFDKELYTNLKNNSVIIDFNKNFLKNVYVANPKYNGLLMEKNFKFSITVMNDECFQNNGEKVLRPVFEVDEKSRSETPNEFRHGNLSGIGINVKENLYSKKCDVSEFSYVSLLRWRILDRYGNECKGTFDVYDAKTGKVLIRQISNGKITSGFAGKKNIIVFAVESYENLIVCAETYVKKRDRWCACMNDDTPIYELSIAGTHDSGAVKIPGQCQRSSIFEQLILKGVRFLDIRCKEIKGTLWVYHGPIDQNRTLDNVLTQCIYFLTANPTEFVIMSIRNEADKNDAEFEKTFFENYFNKAPFYNYWYSKNSIPKLKDVRGKIMLFRRFECTCHSAEDAGIDASPGKWKDKTVFEISCTPKKIKVQDVYQTETAKVKFNDYIVPAMKKSNLLDSWYINYASGCLNGHFSASDISNYVNPKLENYFENKEFRGVLLMDFIDETRFSTCEVSQKICNMNIMRINQKAESKNENEIDTFIIPDGAQPGNLTFVNWAGQTHEYEIVGIEHPSGASNNYGTLVSKSGRSYIKIGSAVDFTIEKLISPLFLFYEQGSGINMNFGEIETGQANFSIGAASSIKIDNMKGNLFIKGNISGVEINYRSWLPNEIRISGNGILRIPAGEKINLIGNADCPAELIDKASPHDVYANKGIKIETV